MFEIWWKDRLIDVVPAVTDVPAGLEVKARAFEPPERVKGELPDWRFSKILAMCLLSFMACVAVMVLTPAGEGGEDDSFFKTRFAGKLTLPPQPEKVIPKLKSISKEKLQQMFSGAQNAPSSRPSGKAKVASLLGGLDDAMRGLFGGGRGDAINAALNNLGNGGGNVAGDGFGGMGPRGNGPGMGPGLGIGGPGARRPGGGGGPSLKGKGDEGPISNGPIRISDGLSRDLVAKVIRAHGNEIKFCYERELQHTPGLAGKVGVSFVIGGTGEVLEAGISESTLDNPAVEECMLSRVRRWKFPEPAGGGTVEVNHPWIFRGAGDNDP